MPISRHHFLFLFKTLHRMLLPTGAFVMFSAFVKSQFGEFEPKIPHKRKQNSDSGLFFVSLLWIPCINAERKIALANGFCSKCNKVIVSLSYYDDEAFAFVPLHRASVLHTHTETKNLLIIQFNI